MSHFKNHTICVFPPELLLQVAQHLSFKDHARWVLADRRHRNCLSPILYLRLPPSKTDASDSGQDPDQITRRDVVQWASEHGLVCTLKNVDEVEEIASFFDTTLTSSIAGLGRLTPIHLAALCGHASVIHYLLQKGADVNASTTDGLLPIHLANTGEVVRLLVDHGARVDRDATPSGVSPLTSSISHKCEPSAVTAFLQLGADPNHVAQDGMTAAEVAIVHGNVDALSILLDSGVDANRPLPSGGFLLYKALWLGTRDHGAEKAKIMVTVLLDRGASPNTGHDSEALDDNDISIPCHTPNLFLAVMMPSSADLVQLLLERGADQHMPYTKYRSPYWTIDKPLRGFENAASPSLVVNLVVAMTNSAPYPPDPEGIPKLKLLIQYGGNIDTAIPCGWRHSKFWLLPYAPWGHHSTSAESSWACPAKVDTTDHTLLQYSLRQNGSRGERSLDIIQPLISLGADVARIDSQGNNTLHLLCGCFINGVQHNWDYSSSMANMQSHRGTPLSSLIDALVNRGADLNAKDAQGKTPLMLLCSHVHTIPTALLVGVLLRHRGLDIKAVDKRGWNVLHYATGEPADPFHSDPCFRLQILLSRRNKERTTFDLSDVNAYSDCGHTPLHLLLKKRYSPSGEADMKRRIMTKTRALRMLVRAGADVRAQTRPPLGRSTTTSEGAWTGGGREGGGETPLHLALHGYEFELLPTIRLLLRHGAATDINHISPSLGMTPLMRVAAAAGLGELSRNTSEDMTRLFVTAGADVQMRDARGRTAWDIFVEFKGPLPGISPWPECLKEVVPQSKIP
ncbi:ankyrin repeat-containing domain protein [Xylariomycetidae sp. FL2044]|nr:ankyrin repeat-containing domain protein [Xylariomycetidae sp. FL2044]